MKRRTFLRSLATAACAAVVNHWPKPAAVKPVEADTAWLDRLEQDFDAAFADRQREFLLQMAVTPPLVDGKPSREISRWAAESLRRLPCTRVDS